MCVRVCFYRNKFLIYLTRVMYDLKKMVPTAGMVSIQAKASFMAFHLNNFLSCNKTTSELQFNGHT